MYEDQLQDQPQSTLPKPKPLRTVEREAEERLRKIVDGWRGHPWPRGWGVPKMANLSPNMNVLNKLLGHVLRNVDPIVLLVLNRWSDSWKRARISEAKIGADVQLLEDIKNAKSQLINDITINMSKIITKTQADELKPDSYAIRSDNVWNAIELQIKRRMTSLIAIVKYAANELEGLVDIPNHDPDPVWTSHWVDGAQDVDVSSEELQKLWGRILAGEVKSPGQTSLRTLTILRSMTQQEAKDFLNLMHFRINDFIVNEALQEVLGRRDANNFSFHFADIGLLCVVAKYPNIELGDNGTWWIYGHHGHTLIIQGLPGQKIGKLAFLNTSFITAAGLELAILCHYQEPNFLYLSHLATFLAKWDCKLLIRKIVYGEDEETQLSDAHVIKPFVKPEERDQNQQEPNNAK